jgi:hypothetical protein
MTVDRANPDLLAARFERLNLIAAWRARLDEALFQILAALAFLGFGLWLMDSWWNLLLSSQTPWAQPWPSGLLGMLVCAALLMQARRIHAQMLKQHQGDWLSALPLAEISRSHARARYRAVRLLIAGLAAMILLLWASWRSPDHGTQLCLALALGITAGALAGAWLPARTTAQVPAPDSAPRGSLPVPDSVTGLPLLGAALEPAAARLPRTAPWIGASFLLFPPSIPVIALMALLVLLSALSLLIDLVSHWRARYLIDVQWLAAEALTPRRLFAAYLPPLIQRTAIAATVVCACLHAIGAPLLMALIIGIALTTAVADAVLCGFATRLQPGRYALLLTLHAVVVVACLQVLPPAAPIAGLACAFSAWRKGNS